MSPDLQDRKIRLLQELEEVETKLAEQKLSETIEQAWQHVVQARALIKNAEALDLQAKRAADEAKRLARQERKAKLEAQILEAETHYRQTCADALGYLTKVQPKRALKPNEAAFLADPTKHAVSISQASALCFDAYHSARIGEARRGLADLRKQLSAI